MVERIKSYCENVLDYTTSFPKLFVFIMLLFGYIAQLFLRNKDYATSISELIGRNSMYFGTIWSYFATLLA
jgi:hypothetical protein